MTTAQLEYRRLGGLTAHPDNPKLHDLDKITESIDLWGFVGAIVVDQRTGYTLGGHGRVQALQRLQASGRDTTPAGLATAPDGEWMVPVTPYTTRDDDHARKILVVLNRTTELGGWDNDLLADLLAELDDLEGTGFTGEDLEGLLADILDGTIVDTAVTDAPSPPLATTPHVQLGQTWQLGRHRLHIGDCTDPATWDAVLDGTDQVDAMWTDPPYGTNIASRRGLGTVSSAEARKRGGATLKGDGDDPEALRDLLAGCFAIATGIVKPGGAWFVAGPPGAKTRIFVDEMVRVGAYRQSLVWVKDRLVLGRSDFQYRHETLHYGWTPGDPTTYVGYRHETVQYGWTPGGKHAFVDDRSITSVLEYPSPTKSEHHPTMKPVELIEDTLTFAEIGHGRHVVDPFAGSGSTAIAAEHLGATAHLIELDPKWADNLLTRWVQAGGDTPTNLEDGSPFPT